VPGRLNPGLAVGQSTARTVSRNDGGRVYVIVRRATTELYYIEDIFLGEELQ
jgi:hypothetical protein